ncbi:uncharacterized protein [Parasteatoda tepidariorum]|uniref:uncharacterized protein n=1 Tax=Parasteatoda tepidariorum TaxID=114398 RepID=UPI00077FD7EA|nr:uncharacterized protein LOC107440832 [Parasteatoda tepidariorum]
MASSSNDSNIAPDSPIEEVFNCHLCDKSYTTNSNRNKHLKKCHNIDVPLDTSNHRIPCAENYCNGLFGTIADLRTHLNEEHGFTFNEDYRFFPTKRNFLHWKKKLEKSERVRFIKTQGDKLRKNAVQQYFHCNRSGSYISQSTGKRKAKVTCKMGHQCTASMVATINRISGEVIVKFVKEHYGHDIPPPPTVPQANQELRRTLKLGKAVALTMSLMKVRIITMLKSLIEEGGFDRVLDKLEVMSAGAGQCVCELKVANEHKNRNGLLHGGMTSTLVDAVSTMALFSKIERYGVSIEMSVSYIRPANIGDELFIEGKILKVGKNLAFLTVDVKNKVTGQIIAQGKHTKFVGDQQNDPSSSLAS